MNLQCDFLGWFDITTMASVLEEDSVFRDRRLFRIHLLHSSVSPSDQRLVFECTKPPLRKIILSTNIAETSGKSCAYIVVMVGRSFVANGINIWTLTIVTIDDVLFVIDSGMVKQHAFDPVSNLSSLDATWISKNSAVQRSGRAGNYINLKVTVC